MDFEEIVERKIVWREDWKLIRYFIHFVAPYARYFALACVFLCLTTFCELTFPYLARTAIDGFIAHKSMKKAEKQTAEVILLPDRPETEQQLKTDGVDFRIQDDLIVIPVSAYQKIPAENLSRLRASDIAGIYHIFWLYLGLFLLNFLAISMQTFTTGYIAQGIIYDMRKVTFDKMLGLRLSYFQKNPLGRLVTRVTNDIEAIQEMFSSVGVNLLKDVLLILGIFGVMAYMNYRLTLIVMVFFPFLLSFTGIFAEEWRRLYRGTRVLLAEVNAFLSEHISLMSLIKIFRREDMVLNNYIRKNQAYFDANFSVQKSNALFGPGIRLTQDLTVAAVLVYGGSLIFHQKLTIGTLVAYTSYISMLFAPIRDLAEKFNIIQSSIAALEKIYAIHTSDEFIHETPLVALAKPLMGEIEFRNVYFRYETEWVLQDVSFKIKPGEKVAIVGYTGAGKSTIINLLLRFYDIQSGEILLDGHRIRDLPIARLRDNISMVQQDITAFSDTIRENVAFSEGDDERVLQALSRVELLETVEKLPGKIDKVLAEDGCDISVGERQLLTFARAVYRDARILVLDEATSNIDSLTEARIQKVLFEILRDRTSIIIAHRLATIRNVDRIIVLHKGRKIEEGSHSELLAAQGIYYRLHRLQFTK
ncbi:MAG: ABC transporter ATP-binding protein [Candidatus Wallbacteria bacterium]|nr:ABC transporter ATP-binding protein [Candidatus Wallbacteria bacterium]